MNGIKEWLDGVDRGPDDCSLVLTLEDMDGKRRKKKSAIRQFEDLVADNAAEHGGTGVVWKQFGYCFGFMARKYTWNDKEIHVTASEQLFLYRWLVLHDDTHKAQKYYLYNMRQRLGKDFLAEVREDVV
jgi:hypothetical protein